MSIQVSINLKEIYSLLCPKCKRRVQKYIKDKIAEKIASQILDKNKE